MTDACRDAKRIPAGLMLAVLLLLGALAVLPFDDSFSDLLRSIGREGGKKTMLQEALALLRPLGKGDVIVLIALAIGLCGWRRKAVQILLALILVSAMVWPLKLTVGRERPNRSNPHSFPSGDTATAVAFCAPFLGTSPWALPATLGLGGGVAAGRVFDGRHYPADVLAGAALGLLAGIASVRLLRRVSWRPRRSWFLGGLLILGAIEVYHLQTARGMPNVSSFLQVWGPLGCFLVAARLIPLLIRRQETAGLFHLNSPRTRRAAILAVCLLASAVYIFVTNSSTLWDRDEPRFSRATVEMVESGNYLYPTFNGALRPDKPILIYWLMSLPVRLLGPAEWTCRLIAPLATVLAALMVYWLGSRLGGARAGILAAAFLVTAPLMIVSGTAATTDALLLMWIVAAICAFAASWLDGFRPRHALLMGIAFGGALLTKGPVGIAVPLLCILLALVLMRKRLPFRPAAYLPWLFLAAAIGVCIFLAWALPANAATNDEFFRKGVGHHVVGRSLEPLESHGGKSLLFSFYYLPVMLFAFFPGTLYLPAFFRGPGQSMGDRPGFLFLLAWAAPVLILMSLVATKLPHYVLPMWPALALMAALSASDAMRAPRDFAGAAGARVGLWCFALTGILLGLVLMAGPWFAPIFGIRIPAVNMGLVFLVTTLAGVRFFRRGRHESALIVSLTGMTAVMLTAAASLLPALEPVKIAPRLADAIKRNTESSVPVATCGFGEPTLNFYLQRGPVEPLVEGDLRTWVRRPGQAVLVVSENVFKRQKEALRQGRTRALATIKGFNYSQGKWITVYALFRKERD